MGDASSSAAGNALGTIFVGYATSEIAKSMGVDDNAAALLGLGAGYYAGTNVFGPGQGTPPTVPQNVTFSPPAAPRPAPQQTQAPPALPAPITTEDVTAPMPEPSAAPTRGGMLTRGLDTSGMLSMGAPAATVPQPTPGTPQGTTADRMIQAGTTPQGAPQPQSWWDKLLSNDKTMDYIMAGIGGYAQARQREKELNMPYERADKLAKTWKRGDATGIQSIRQRYPSQGG